MSGGGFRVSSIPTNVKKTILNIKEITGNHSDEEVYAMLKECSMDPNETTQKLLLQDTFHEVKRKKEKKKEIQTNRDTVDLRWRSGPPGRGGRGGRGNYTSRYAAQDAGFGRTTVASKENGVNRASDKAGSISSPPVAQFTNNKDTGSSVTVMANGPICVVSGVAKNVGNLEVLPGSVGTKQPEMPPHSQKQLQTGASNISSMSSVAPATLSGVSSASDPVLVPSGDSRVPVSVGAIKREVGTQFSAAEPNLNIPADHKTISSKMGGKSQGVGKNQGVESSSSRPSSNHGSRLQQAIGSQKVGANKEWKPKPSNMSAVQGTKIVASCESNNIAAETSVHTEPVPNVADSDDVTKKLQKNLESIYVRDSQHVIIPNHIHVPESVRSALSFGSFDAAFAITSRSNAPENQIDSKPVYELQQEAESAVEEQTMSQNDVSPTEEADYIHSSQASEQVTENLSSVEGDVPSSSVPDSSDSKETTNGPQHPSAHTSVNYNFGLMPPILGNPLGPGEASETQARDISRVPSFVVVQQPVDPSSFYAQFYRSGAEIDGRISPFASPGIAAKYNGNVAVLSSQTSQSPPEGGNSMVLSTAVQTPLATQAAGVMANSVAMTQQQMALFRQPPGVHLPHYPPNYLPYGHYFSPFYVPPPAMHQFLGSNAFPQQAQTGSVYPGQAAATATGVKFPVSQYKPGNIPGNSGHMNVGGSYGPYGTLPAGYNTGSAATTGNSTANEDLAASQFKENNVYITGQQSEGSGVWIPAPGREISSLPANSFYNLPPQGQHMTFGPAQGGQGTFAGIYHPAQAVTPASVHPLLQQSQGGVDMVGATPNAYQQPQHAQQLNWPNNY